MAPHEPKDEKAEPFGLYCVVVDAGEGGLASAATPSLATSTCHSVFGAHPATDGASRRILLSLSW